MVEETAMGSISGKPIRAVTVRLKTRWRWARWLLRKQVWIKIHHKGKPISWAQVPVDKLVKVSKADGVAFVHAVDRLFCTIYALRGKLIGIGRIQ